MNDTIIIVYLLFCGIVFLAGCAIFHHYTEEIPGHKWDDMMEDFTKRAPAKVAEEYVVRADTERLAEIRLLLKEIKEDKDGQNNNA